MWEQAGHQGSRACGWVGALIEILFPGHKSCYVFHFQAALPWHTKIMGYLAAKPGDITFTYETLDSAAIIQEEGAQTKWRWNLHEKLAQTLYRYIPDV